MKAIIFPGQGSQKSGMASEFHSNFQIVKDIFRRADEALKFNLSKIILNGTDEELKNVGVTGLFLGSYFPWDGLSNSLIAQGFPCPIWPQVGSSWQKNMPSMLQAGLKLAPSWFQVRPKLAPSSPKLGQVGANLAPGRAK